MGNIAGQRVDGSTIAGGPARPGGPRRWAPVVAGALLATMALAGCSNDDPEPTAASTTSTTVATTTTLAALDEPTRPWVIAHRGASGLAPEHTFASYDRAVQAGADFIELDIQLTSDRKLVVLHDPVLDRTARGSAENCTGSIDAHTLAQVETCDAGTWFNEANPDRADPTFADQRIPTLPAVLDRFGTDVRYYIETKKLLAGKGMEEALVEALDAAGFTKTASISQQIVIQSFDAESLRTVKRLRPDLTLVQLLYASGEPIDPATLGEIASYADGIGPSVSNVDEALLTAAHERCLVVHPYTADDPAELAKLLDLGVDGIFTNRPDTLAPLADRHELAAPCP